jgi:hypothetical protein
LTINGSGVLDLVNHSLLTDTSGGIIRGYLVSGFDGGIWKGPGITSSNAISNPAQFSVGYAEGSDPHNPVPGVAAGKVLVRAVPTGDVNLDGTVNFADVLQFLGAGKYNTGQPSTYVTGDVNYDGINDSSDLLTIAQSGNYDKVTLTGTAHGSVIGHSGNGVPDFVYNSVTGDVQFKTDGVLVGGSGRVTAIQLLSASNKVIAGNSTLNGPVDVVTSAGFDGANFNATGYADGIDLGNVLPAGLTPSQLTTDLTVSYQIFGQGGLAPAEVISVPEPTALSLLALGAAGMLARRRRRQYA